MSRSNSFRNTLIAFGKELDEENDIAYDLWTWLPSHKEAKKYHGDYAHEFTPSIFDIMSEAASFISFKCNPTPEQLKDDDIFSCPCGKDHGEGKIVL